MITRLSALGLILGLMLGSALGAVTNTVADLEYATVSAAISNANHGDLIMLPSGSNSWSAYPTIYVTKQIRIRGQGQGLTILDRGTNTGRIFQFCTPNGNNPGRSNVFELGYMTLDCGSGLADALATFGGGLNNTNRNFRFHHLTFERIKLRGIRVFGRAEGVIDHCQFNAPYNLNAQGHSVEGFQRATTEVTNSANATYDWPLGSLVDFVYVENNGYNFGYDNDGAWDTYWDGHAVYRFNNITNSNIAVHENGASRAAMVYEFYGNYITNKSFGTTNGVVNWLTLRSGYGVIWSNTIQSPNAAIVGPGQITYYRASGTNVWPANQVGNPQSYPYNVTGTNKLDGNSNSVTIGWPAFDMPGWGDPAVFGPTNTVWTFHGVYSWGNTFNNTNVGLDPHEFCLTNCNAGLIAYDGVSLVPTPHELMQNGRDYFNDTVKPGYTAAVYPHPLVTADNMEVSGATNSITPTSLNVGTCRVNTTLSGTLTVSNSGNATLTGVASTTAPFSVSSGASYSVAPGGTASVGILYSPSVAASDSQDVVFTGGGGFTVPVTGTATNAVIASVARSTVLTSGKVEVSGSVTVR